MPPQRRGRGQGRDEPGFMTLRGQSGALTAMSASAIALVGTMGIVYIVSQFLRSSVGVIAPDLAAELGLTAGEIGLLSSAFFLVFAAVQLPLGVALDRFGPRACLLVGAAITVVGVVLFAVATSPGGLIAARGLMGLGCSASFMAPLALYARKFPPDRFATLTGLQLGLGSIGVLLATAPLAFAAAAIGWRGSFLFTAAVTLLVGVLIALVVRDDRDRATRRHETLAQAIAGIRDVLRTRSVAHLFLMQFAGYPSFLLVVGLWGGPYLTHVYGYGLAERGNFLLIAAVTQVFGSILWGPTDRLMRSYKIPALIGTALMVAAYAVLAFAGPLSEPMLAAWFALFGLVCASTPVAIAHGKSLFPPHLVGRGLTLLNMGTMVGVFVSQSVSGLLINLFPQAADGSYPLAAYRLVFALQGGFILLTCLIYLWARDPRREGGDWFPHNK
jgi:MFS family permease